MPLITGSTPTETTRVRSHRSRCLARLAVDGALLIVGAVVLWGPASRSLLLVALAVTACLVGGATALARIETEPRQVVASATAASALAASKLLSTTTLWTTDLTVASVLLLVAATGVVVSWESATSTSRWSWRLAIVATTFLIGPVWALWYGDDSISPQTAIRLLAVAFVAFGASWSFRPRTPIATRVGIAFVAIAGCHVWSFARSSCWRSPSSAYWWSPDGGV